MKALALSNGRVTRPRTLKASLFTFEVYRLEYGFIETTATCPRYTATGRSWANFSLRVGIE